MEWDFNKIIIEHFERYPFMKARDAAKLCYQSEFGCGHFIADEKRAYDYLIEEMCEASKLSCTVNESFYENIGGGYVRVNIRKLDENGMSPQILFDKFIRSSKNNKGTKGGLTERFRCIRHLTRECKAPFELGEFDEFTESYLELSNKKGLLLPIGHSDEYRQMYKPAYRVICKDEIEF